MCGVEWSVKGMWRVWREECRVCVERGVWRCIVLRRVCVESTWCACRGECVGCVWRGCVETGVGSVEHVWRGDCRVCVERGGMECVQQGVCGES